MGKGGKSKGKIAFTLIGAALGGFGANFMIFGTKAVLSSALFGASLASTLWSVTQKPNQFGNLDTDYSQDDYSRFNQVTNDINQNAVIPVIYGTRKYGGLQVYHNPYNGNRYLQKDVVICESGIQGIYDVMANEELIKDDTNISIYNIQYKDAAVSRPNKSTLRLYANGKNQDYTLGDTDDYNAQTSLLNTVIDKIKAEAGNGWKIDGAVDDRTSKGISANSMQFNKSTPVKCYCNPEDAERKNKVILDDRGYKIGTYELHQNEAPDNYNEVGGYPNLAWIRSDLVASSRLSGSNPTINAIVQGMKVKVWKNNQWVTEYSENPAWIIRDFLTSTRYGAGQWITDDMLDLESFKEVAAYCDEEVEYIDFDGSIKKVPRYQLNIVIDSAKTPIDHLSSMLAVFGGFITFGKQIALRVEKAETPVYDFDDDTIVKDSMSIGQTSLDDTPNRYKIGYFDPAQSWTEVKVVIEDLELQHEQDNKIFDKTVTLAGCTSQNQALRIGRLYRDLNKVCSLTLSFSVATQGMMLECGDVVNVTYGGIFTKMPVRITQIEETNNGVYQLTCRQYNASIYNDELGSQIINPNYTNSNSPYGDKPPAVDGLVAEESTYTSVDGILNMGMNITWDDTYYEYFDHYQVSLSTDGINYKPYVNTFENEAYIGSLAQGSYWVSVQIVTKDGIKGVPAITTVEISGKDRPPSDVIRLDTDLLNDGTRRFWWEFKYPNPNDISGFKLKYTQGAVPNWDSAYELHSGLILAQPFETQALRQGTHTVMIKAVDNAGNESGNACSTILNLGDPLEDNVLWKIDLSDNNWSKTEHNGVVNSDNVVESININKSLLLNAHINPNAYGQFYLLYDLNSASTVEYCIGGGANMWKSPITPFWKPMFNDDYVNMTAAKPSEFDSAIEVVAADTKNFNEESGNLTCVNAKQASDNGAGINYFWQFKGLYKPYTGKVIIKGTDSLHIRVNSVPNKDEKSTISKLVAVIDVPDRMENFDNINIPKEGLVLPIKTPNYWTTAVRVNAIQSVVEGNYDFEIVDRVPCKIRFYRIENDAGFTRTPIAVSADITWQGFQREVY